MKNILKRKSLPEFFILRINKAEESKTINFYPGLKFILTIGAWMIPLIILYVMFNSLYNSSNMDVLLRNINDKPSIVQYTLLFLLVVLMPLNWGIEAKKWQLAIKRVSTITFQNALQAVLSGLSMNAITPLGTGDIVARMLHLNELKRKEVIYGFFWIRMTQLFCSLFFGSVAVLFLIFKFELNLELLLFVLALSLVILISLIIKKDLLLKVFKSRIIKPYAKYLTPDRSISRSNLIQIGLLSLIRYTVFTLQFYIALYLFGLEGDPFYLLMGISWVFLIRTITPAISIFSDLVVRELSSVFYFGLFGFSLPPVAAAAALIWLINIFLPTLIGTFFLPINKIIQDQ